METRRGRQGIHFSIAASAELKGIVGCGAASGIAAFFSARRSGQCVEDGWRIIQLLLFLRVFGGRISLERRKSALFLYGHWASELKGPQV